ncbi:hypothetical protein [Chachezhania antarctica]|uniref:hypothetical protein n=1 Tax=Chachezhania antarctica TaxID=2340860 RepID=UPI000EB07CC5|nr:hypothetical protein [Chachezhania antarctica]|tara:strand:+ start:895 stop:1113 length:219 start_codon:yes stop_codon:yes gene_type:complete
MFDIIIWAGAVLVLAGIAGLIWCVLKVIRARRARLDDDALRVVLQSVVPLNLAALLVSALGLMLVAVGVILG